MAIKISIGKLSLAQPLASYVNFQIAQYNIQLLTITFNHSYKVEELPFHHKDPFDRLIIAQAILEDLVILTRDSEILKYDVQTAW
jgi:PIN domain nuclease of toxin-antitoxin system